MVFAAIVIRRISWGFLLCLALGCNSSKALVGPEALKNALEVLVQRRNQLNVQGRALNNAELDWIKKVDLLQIEVEKLTAKPHFKSKTQQKKARILLEKMKTSEKSDLDN
jgi:hypothetical protein